MAPGGACGRGSAGGTKAHRRAALSGGGGRQCKRLHAPYLSQQLVEQAVAKTVDGRGQASRGVAGGSAHGGGCASAGSSRGAAVAGRRGGMGARLGGGFRVPAHDTRVDLLRARGGGLASGLAARAGLAGASHLHAAPRQATGAPMALIACDTRMPGLEGVAPLHGCLGRLA